MTGSALNIYNGGAPVTRQIELAKAVFAAGVPFFGSCWGLQVAVTAAGGEVRANPRGREFGFARRILLTEAGEAHRLFAGKPATFEAPTVHRDEIASLPSNAVTLATNDMGLQAAAFTHGLGTFWGVQYHPEYDYLDIAAAAERYGTTLVREGCSGTSRRSRRSAPSCAPCRRRRPMQHCCGSTDSDPRCKTRRCGSLRSRIGSRRRCDLGPHGMCEGGPVSLSAIVNAS